MSTTSKGRRLAHIALIALATFVAAEGVARVTATRLGPATQWFSAEAHERIAYVESATWDGDTIDTIFIGSSVIASGFDLQYYDTLTGHHTANLAVPSADVLVMDAWLTQEVLPRIEDRGTVTRVVYGLTTIALNDNASTAAIDRYDQQLANGVGWRGSMHRAAFDRLALVRHAPSWSSPASALSDVLDPPTGDALTTPFFDLPLPPHTDLTVVDDPNRLRTEALVNFEIGEAQRIALQHLFAELNARDIEVVIVLTPVHSGYSERHPNGNAGFDAARDWLKLEALAGGATFVDLSGSIDDRAFLDHVHVDRPGIQRFTDLIACAVDAVCD